MINEEAKKIIDIYKNGGSFDRTIYKAVTLADLSNLGLLYCGYQKLVDAHLISTQGKDYADLYCDTKGF